MVWHDCKTDPPKKEGWYILVRNYGSELTWLQAYWSEYYQRWQDHYDIYHEKFCYKWAEIDMSEVE